MTRSLKSGIAWAIRRKTGYGGMCLKHVRDTWLIGSRYADAITAANKNTRLRKQHWSRAPLGATLFWKPKGSPYGHTATITATGKGAMISTTDSQKRTTQVYPAGTFEKVGYPYIGWSDEVNGSRHPVGGGGASPSGTAKKPAARGKTQVFRINTTAVRKLQAVLGTKQDGKIDPKDSLVIRALQKKARTTQDGYLSDPSQLGRKIQRFLNSLRDKKGKRYFALNVDGHIDGPATTAALERYLLKLNGKFTNLHKA